MKRDHRLFNCMTGARGPEPREVTSLELCGVREHLVPETGETCCEAPVPEEEADFWTVYYAGPATDDLPMALTDIHDRRDLSGVLAALITLYGVPVRDRRWRADAQAETEAP